jgi:hypothetical protein
VDSRRRFFDFLRQAGFAQASQEPVLPAQPVAQAAPQYVSRPDLRIRGNPDNTNQQTRQYAAPMPSRADLLEKRYGAQQPAPAAVPVSQPESQAPVNMVRPEVVSSNVPNEMEWAQYVAAWKAANSQRQQQGLPPIDPQGFIYPEEKWREMTPERQAGVYAQLAQTTPVRDEFSTGANDPVSEIIRGAGDFLGDSASAFADTPIFPTSIDPLRGGGSEPVSIGDAAPEIAKPVVSGLGKPEEWWWNKQIEASIQYAQTGEMPAWASLYYKDKPGWSEYGPLGGITKGFNAVNDDLFLPAYLAEHPEAVAELNAVVAEANRRGTDPNEAVSTWWSAKQGFLKNLISRGVNDPLNALAIPALGGKGLTAVAKTAEAERGASAGTKALKGVGFLLEGPDLALNAPGKLLNRVFGEVGGAVSNIPGVRNALESSDVQSYQDALRTVEEGVGGTVDTLMRAADDIRAQKQAVEHSALRSEGRLVDTYTPPRTLTPEEQLAEQKIQARAASRGTAAEPAVTPAAPVDTMDGISPPVATAETPPLSAIPTQQPLTPAATIPQTAAPITPEIVPNGNPVTAIDTSGFARLRTLDEVEKPGYSLDADPARVGSTDPLKPERAMDSIAAANPQAWDAIKSDPAFSEYARTQYEPARNALRTATVDATDLVPGAEPLPKNYAERKMAMDAGAKDAPITRYEGMNKASSAILDADYFGRLRLYAHANGVPLDRVKWQIPPVLQKKIADRALVKMGKRADQTFKDQTREGLVHAYVHADEADAPYILNSLEEAGVVHVPKADEFGRKIPPITGDTLEFRAYQRYLELSRARRLATMPPEELDELIERAGGTVPEAVIPADDLDKLPTPDDWRSFGDEAAATATEQMLSLDPAIRSAVVKQVADWTEANADRIAVGTANERLFLGLEYTAEVRTAALKNGGDIDLPPAPLVTMDSSTDDWVRAIALDPDEANTAAFRQELIDMEFMSPNGTPDGLAKTNPLNFASRDWAHQNYQTIKRIRTALHGTVEDAARPLGPSPRGPVGQKLGPRPGAGTPPESTVAKKTFKEVTGEDKRPASLTDIRGDQYLDDAYQSGGIDEDMFRFGMEQITIPAHVNEAGRVVRAAQTRRVVDIVLEQMAKHEDVLTAHRAAGSEIAAAIRQASKDATLQITDARKLTMPEVNKFLRANRYYLNLIREGYMFNPARLAAGGSLDAIGNAWFQIMSGHGGTAIQTLNPLAWLGFAKHTMRGDDFLHPVETILKSTGMRADSSWTNILTRDLMDADPVHTTWSDFLGKKLKMGKVGDKASGVFALKWGKALRHGIDQNARAGVAWDTAMKALPDARNDFLISIRRTQGDAVANDLAAKLDRSGQFSPEDVLKLTDDRQLAKQWRESIAGVREKMTAEVNKVHFNFRMTKADDFARNLILFHFWQSRALVFYPRTVLSNAYLLNAHVKFWDALGEEAERKGLDGPMSVFASFMKGDGGLYGWVDPVSWFIPYTMFRDAQVSYGGQSSFDKWTNLLFLHPGISAVATGVGISKEFAPLLPTSGVQNIVKAVIDYDRNHGDWLGKGPGITTDLVAYYQRVVINAINDALTKEGGAHDVEMPPIGTSDKRQVRALIIESAEQGFGVPYAEMTAEQQMEVARALNAVDFGTPEGNPRAMEALKTWSEGQLVEAGMRTIVPGQSYVRSEYDDNLRDAVGDAYETPFTTPAEDATLAANDVLTAGSPESTTLEVERDQMAGLGSDQQRALYEGWNSIAYDTLPGAAVETIGGEEWYGYQVNNLSQDERMKLADLWALENSQAAVDPDPNDGKTPPTELDQYRDQRDEFLAGSDELGGYYEYRDRAEEFEGGVAGWREYAADQSDEFAQAMAKQRQMFVERGYVPSVVERRLDQWATSTDGFNAARGVRNKISDPAPKDAPAEIPLSNAETEAMVTSAVEQGVKDAGVSGFGGSSAWNEEYDRPQFQVDIIEEYNAYVDLMGQFEAEFGGPPSNFTTRQGKAAVEKWMTDHEVDLSSGLKELLKWLDENPDGTIDGYFAEKDAEYEAKKAKEGA